MGVGRPGKELLQQTAAEGMVPDGENRPRRRKTRHEGNLEGGLGRTCPPVTRRGARMEKIREVEPQQNHAGKLGRQGVLTCSYTTAGA